jgi:peroxiredoxin
MRTSRLLRTVVAPAVLLGALCVAPAFAEEPPKPGDDASKPGAPGAPGTLVDTAGDPAKAPKVEEKTKVQATPEAQEVLNGIRDAYAKVKTLSLTGKLSADLDVDGTKKNDTAELTASYAAPNLYRHVLKGNVEAGSTGEKVYAYQPSDNVYFMKDAPAARPATAGDLPGPIGKLLDQQNPSLLLALVADAAAQLTDGVSRVERGADVKIGEVAYTALNFTTQDSGEVQLLVDPSTKLVRKITADLRKRIEASGQQDVKQAKITIDYTDVKTGAGADGATATPKPAEFAWAPPQGARDFAALAAADDKPADAAALEGKVAPDFTLKGTDGKEVKLSALKGSVVVLDFWATWCPPCRASLPHLDTLNKEMTPKGVKVFAVNLEEEVDVVKKFVTDTKLTTAVLLDSTGATAQSYGASAIPQTVVVGKDGKVKKVFVGFNPNESPKALKDAVEAAMK